MAMPILAPAQIAQLSGLVAQYISNQRKSYSPRATRLSPQQKTALGGFFEDKVLDEVRLLVLVGERVANPAFYSILTVMGFNNLPDQSRMAAITFSDTVVSHVPLTEGLLFHEMVHVEQYRQLGIERFADLYVRGFLSGNGYDGIPLERNAYQLGAQYERDRAITFPVAQVVNAWIAEQRF
jgi:hypothetical protein